MKSFFKGISDMLGVQKADTDVISCSHP